MLLCCIFITIKKPFQSIVLSFLPGLKRNFKNLIVVTLALKQHDSMEQCNRSQAAVSSVNKMNYSHPRLQATRCLTQIIGGKNKASAIKD